MVHLALPPIAQSRFDGSIDPSHRFRIRRIRRLSNCRARAHSSATVEATAPPDRTPATPSAERPRTLIHSPSFSVPRCRPTRNSTRNGPRFDLSGGAAYRSYTAKRRMNPVRHDGKTRVRNRKSRGEFVESTADRPQRRGSVQPHRAPASRRESGYGSVLDDRGTRRFESCALDTSHRPAFGASR